MPHLLPPTILFTFLLLLLSPPSTGAAAFRRRLLHHPLFPADQPLPSSGPTPAPQPQPTGPKYPFSTLPPPDTTPQNPFFPFYTSPPPPPPPPASSSDAAAFPTFPANISSLVIPSSSHTSHPKIKLISLILSISLFSTFIFASLLLLLLRHRRHRPLKSDSLRLFPPNTTPSDTTATPSIIDASKKPPPPLFPRRTAAASSTSSEFLYLGTLVSSRDADYSGPHPIATSPGLTYHRLGSPELQPLPPLPRQQSHQNAAGNLTSSEEDENEENDDEFFSPRGSTVNNHSPHRTRSSPQQPKTLNSPTYSISPDNSPSVVLNSGSPQSLLSKSPDSSVIFPASIPRFIPPPPPREPRTLSPFSPSSTDDCGTRDCSPRPSDFSGAGVYPPPPPPPPPAARLWEGVPANGPPELVAPSRKVNLGNSVSNSEEMVKPKLKPLHWDKVRACSDRAMVWDHLKSSSFQ